MFRQMFKLGENSVLRAKMRHQLISTLIVNLTAVSFGAVNGWASPSQIEFKLLSSPLETGPITTSQASYMAASTPIGCIFGAMYFAWLADSIGRKRSLLLLALPSIIGWRIIPGSQIPAHIYLARFLGGVAGGGCFTLIPIYISELAEDSVCCTLGTFMSLSWNVGTLIIYILSSNSMKFAELAWVSLLFPVLFVICFVFMPETPVYLAQRNKMVEAERSLRYYRNINPNTSTELKEKFQLELQNLRAPDIVEKAGEEELKAMLWPDFSDAKTRKAFFISLGLLMFSNLSGGHAMLNFIVSIMKDIGSSLQPPLAATIVSGAMLVGSYMATLLVQRLGRKRLLYISSLGMALGQCSMGVYNYLTTVGYETSSFNWVPIVAFAFMMFIGVWGILTLPFLIVSELLPARKLSRTMMILMTLFYLFNAIINVTFTSVSEYLRLYGIMFLFAGFSFTSILFVALFVPETKDRTVEAIWAKL